MGELNYTTVAIDKQLHLRLSVIAAMRRMTVKAALEEAVLAWLPEWEEFYFGVSPRPEPSKDDVKEAE